MNLRKGKAVRLGKATAIILPTDWVRGHGIEGGDELQIRYDGVVTIRAPRKEDAGTEG